MQISTVIYTEASQKSIDTLKEMINHFLTFTGSTQKADDLFEFKLYNPDLNDQIKDWIIENIKEFIELKDQVWGKYYADKEAGNITKEEWRNIFHNYKDKLNYAVQNIQEVLVSEEVKSNYQEFVDEANDDYDFKNVEIIVKPKEDNEHLAEVAKVLSDLEGLFNINAERDG